ncbi:MAG: tetratricopeptide repeat protein [Bacteroidota bacterium]
MKNTFLLPVIFALVFASCSEGRQTKIDKIKELEKVVHSKTETTFNVAKAKELADAYVDFAKEYPDDTAAASCCFKAASISMNTGNPNQAIELFDKIISDYPDFKKVPECMFLKAFTYDNFLKNIKKAEEGYNAFIKKYPDNEFADDAQSLLGMLGKTPEQISAELIAKQKTDTLEANNKK